MVMTMRFAHLKDQIRKKERKGGGKRETEKKRRDEW